MKNKAQVLQFLRNSVFASQEAIDNALRLCSQYKYAIDFPIVPRPNEGKVTSSEFAGWLENGFGAGDIALHGDYIVLVGAINYPSAHLILGTKSDMSSHEILDSVVKGRYDTLDSLSSPSEEQVSYLKRLMSIKGLQYFPETDKVGERLFPTPMKLVEYRLGKSGNYDHGLGTVCWSSKKEDKVSFFCIYSYSQDKCFFASEAPIICQISDGEFFDVTPGIRKRFYRELRRVNKNWNDKMHRLEPLEPKVKEGEMYWYIDDKMEVRSSKESGKKTSHFRYLAANYFKTKEDALECLSLVTKVLEDYMATK